MNGDLATFETHAWLLVIPVHREVRFGTLGGRRQVQPDLEELGGVGAGVVDEGKHLGVHDAVSGGHPLEVAAAEARRGAHRVGVIDEPLAHDGDRLEATMRMTWKAGHDVSVVHAPAVTDLEVHADASSGEGLGRRAELLVPRRVVIEVVDAEQEGVRSLPREPQRLHGQDRHERETRNAA